jgi:hypothetical protein
MLSRVIYTSFELKLELYNMYVGLFASELFLFWSQALCDVAKLFSAKLDMESQTFVILYHKLLIF